MIPSKEILLSTLPPFNNNSILIEKNQSVIDIVKEVCGAHQIFASDYDTIAPYFNTPSLYKICQNLFDFCKQNIRYRIEPEVNQTTKSPAAIIALGDSIGGDCKHYASFIGGVLDAIQRTTGRKIDWCYRFASYNDDDPTPGHVFVVVKDVDGNEIWVDPVLSSLDKRVQPTFEPLDKKIKNSNMPLYRISGFDDYKSYAPPMEMMLREAMPGVTDVVIEPDPNLTPQIEDNLKMLLYYGVMNEALQINEQAMADLALTLNDEDYMKVWNALNDTVNQASIGGLFDTIWRGVKKVTLAAPRASYLALVALNVFGTANKLYKVAFNADGSYYQNGKDKLKTLWQDRLGGDWTVLENTIKSGNKKNRILGVDEVQNVIGAAPAAIAAAAVTIIVAMAPLIKSVLDARKAAGYDITAADLANINPTTANTGIFGWIQNNPMEAAAIGVGGGYLIYSMLKRRKPQQQQNKTA